MLSVTVEGEGADLVPTDETNLAAKAALTLGELTGNDTRLAIHIKKGIPVAGDALWGTEWTRDRLAECGAALGSDIPFSMHGGTALATGRGERLTPVLERGSFSWVLALADGGLSTPVVYRELDRQREAGPVGLVSEPSGVLAALRQGDPVALGHALGNDLQPAALSLAPYLLPLLDAARELGSLGAVVSGSGPTVAVLARDGGHADALAAGLSATGHCVAVRRADGPVGGAKIVEAL